MKRNSYFVIAATVFAVATPVALAAGTGAGKTTSPTATQAPASGNLGTNAPTTNAMSDAKMAQELRESLARDTSLSSQAQNLRVSSNNGTVTVSGTVASDIEKSKIEAMARQAAGEKAVVQVAVE